MAQLAMVEVAPVSCVTTAKRLLAVGVALLLAGAGLIAVCIVANDVLLWPTTDRGTCFVFDAHWCSSLSVATIEADSGVLLPPKTIIIDSGSARSLKSGHETALLSLPAGTTTQLHSGYDWVAPTNDDRSAVSALEEQGVVTITEHWLASIDRGPTTALVTVGVDNRGESWAYVRVMWNG